MVFVGIYKYFHYVRNKSTKIHEDIFYINVIVYDYFDNVRSLKKDIFNFIKEKIYNISSNILNCLKNKSNIINLILLISMLAYSAYIRLYDACKNAAPAMSDSYTTLVWMKEINLRQLFPDGIYPEGFHIYMATIQKIAFIDSLYILRYTGPLNCIFITVGIYFVVSRTCKDSTPGIVGACIYGILIKFLYDNWERQAATNSQEFGYVFIIPTIYFFCRYLMTNKKRDLLTAFSGLAIAGLVHTISYVCIAIGVSILIIVSMCINIRKYWKNVYKICLCGIVTGLLSIVPVAIGLIMHIGFNSSSQDFLTHQGSQAQAFHILSKIDYAGIASLGIVFIYLIFNIKHLEEKLTQVTMLFTGIAAFLIYYLGALTKYDVISTRLTDFWSLMEPVIIGIAFYIVLGIIRIFRVRKVLELIMGTSFVLISIFYFRPTPIIPYKMEYNTNEEQYLRINNMLNPTEWTVVSQIEGYSIVLGRGYHVMMGDFLKDCDPEYYDPKNPYLYYKNDKHFDKTQDVFLFEEKNVFTTQFQSSVYNYSQRKQQNKQLEQWVAEYKKKHSNISVFYEDKNMKIYRIHQGTSRAETLSRIWGYKL
jgi:hypothetical protein